jgi:hypothetical protein
MSLFVLLLAHCQFFFGSNWSWAKESSCIAIFVAMAAVWDFIWFILNAHFKLSGFKKDLIKWHGISKWYFGLPSDYYVAMTIATIIPFVASWFQGSYQLLWHQLIITGMMIATVIGSIIVAPLYHRWYWWMRRK